MVNTNVLMNLLMSEMLETDAVCEWFAARLEGEGEVNITKGQPLAIHSTYGHGPHIIAVLNQEYDEYDIHLKIFSSPLLIVGCTKQHFPCCCFCI